MPSPRLPSNLKAVWTGNGTDNLVGLSAADGFSWLGAAQDGLIVGYEIINVDQLLGGISAERELGFGQWNNGTSTLSRADGPGDRDTVGVVRSTNATPTNRESFTDAETKLVSIVALTELMPAEVHAADYGAKGDGTTNDGAAINAAISALGSRGGAVHFEALDYLIDAVEIAIPNGVRLQGVYGDLTSLGTRLQLTGGAKIDMGGTRGGELRDLRIDSDSTTVPAIDFDDESNTSSYPRIDRCNVIGGAYALRVNNVLELRVNDSRFLTIAGSTNALFLDGTEAGVGGNGGIDGAEFKFCTFGSAAEASANVIDADGGVASVKFVMCVNLFGNKGLVLRHVGGSTTQEPRFFYWIGGGYENQNNACVDLAAGSLVKFVGAYLSTDAPTSVNGDTIRVGSGGDFILTGCEVRAGARDGLRIFNGSNATLTGNHIGNNGRAETGVGVRLIAAGKVVITGNQIGAFSDGSNAQTHAIGLTTQTVPVTIVGNDLADNATGALTGTAPANSVVVSNRGLEGTAVPAPHTHSADDVTTGTFDTARIPDLSATYQPRDGDLDNWAGKTAPSGAAVGTTDAQTLTQKVLQDYTETVQALGNISGTVAVNYASGSIATGTLTGDVTSLSFTNMDVGATITLVLSLGGNSLADPSTTQWPGGVQPDIGTGKVVVSYTKETSAPLYQAFLGGGNRA